MLLPTRSWEQKVWRDADVIDVAMGLDEDLQAPIRAMLQKAQNPAEKSRKTGRRFGIVDISGAPKKRTRPVKTLNKP